MNLFSENSTAELIEILLDLIKANQLERAHEIIIRKQKELRNIEYQDRFKQVSEINNQILKLKLEWKKSKKQIENMREKHFKNNYFFDEKLMPELENFFNSAIEKLRKLKEKKASKDARLKI